MDDTFLQRGSEEWRRRRELENQAVVKYLQDRGSAQIDPVLNRPAYKIGTEDALRQTSMLPQRAEDAYQTSLDRWGQVGRFARMLAVGDQNQTHSVPVDAAGQPLPSGNPQYKDWLVGQGRDLSLNTIGMGLPFAARGALGMAGGQILKAKSEVLPSPTIDLLSVEHFLTGNKIPFRKDTSNVAGSLSSYYYVQTPNGQKKIRVSDHLGGYGEDIGIRLGQDAADAFKAISKTIGLEYTPELASRAMNVAKLNAEKMLIDWQQKKASAAFGPSYDYDGVISRWQKKLDSLNIGQGDEIPGSQRVKR